MSDKTTSFWQSTTVKMIITGILILVMLIPAALIKGLIHERESRREEARLEIGTKWGGMQTVSGPVLAVPYRELVKTKEEVYEVRKYYYFLPDRLEISGEIIPGIRYRGIFKTAVYQSQLELSGSFSRPDWQDLDIAENDLFPEDAFVFVGIPDMRGIQNQVEISWNDSLKPVDPGTRTKEVVQSGFSADVELGEEQGYTFSFKLDLNGSESLNFTPLGKNTAVNLTSDWNNPSFDGAFLPDRRDIGEDGFTAGWEILHLNRSFPQAWIGSEYNIDDAAFGVSLLMPVDQYQKSMRSAKYAIMFIALTFMVFFFSEVLNKYRIHPIQYLLVGIALSIFYVLLLSLSEHIGFSLAYLVASVSIIAMITAYTWSIFKNRRHTLIMASSLVVLYIFLFTLLQLQDFSLLMGSVGLFVVLAIVMYLSRNIDWYEPVSGR